MPVDPGQTGLRARPHYLDVGDLLDDDYADKPVDEIDLGDLDDLLSFRELVRLTSDDADADRPDQLNLLGAVLSAEGTVDSYIGRRYNVPLLTQEGYVPRDVYDAAKKLVRYNVYASSTHTPPSVISAYEQVMRWLQDVSMGRAVIPDLVITPDSVEQRAGGERSVIGEVIRGTSIFGHRRASNLDCYDAPRGFDYPG